MSKNYQENKLVHVKFPASYNSGSVGYMGRLVQAGDEYSLVFSTHTHKINQVQNQYIQSVEETKWSDLP